MATSQKPLVDMYEDAWGREYFRSQEIKSNITKEWMCPYCYPTHLSSLGSVSLFCPTCGRRYIAEESARLYLVTAYYKKKIKKPSTGWAAPLYQVSGDANVYSCPMCGGSTMALALTPTTCAACNNSFFLMDGGIHRMGDTKEMGSADLEEHPQKISRLTKVAQAMQKDKPTTAQGLQGEALWKKRFETLLGAYATLAAENLDDYVVNSEKTRIRNWVYSRVPGPEEE